MPEMFLVSHMPEMLGLLEMLAALEMVETWSALEMLNMLEMLEMLEVLEVLKIFPTLAMPEALVAPETGPCAVMPELGNCQLMLWPPEGAPFDCASTCTVQEMVAPAVSEREGVSAVSTGAVPPEKCACKLEPLSSEAVTTDKLPSTAVTFMVAWPSPVAVTEQAGWPQLSAAVPLATE